MALQRLIICTACTLSMESAASFSDFQRWCRALHPRMPSSLALTSSPNIGWVATWQAITQCKLRLQEVCFFWLESSHAHVVTKRTTLSMRVHATQPRVCCTPTTLSAMQHAPHTTPIQAAPPLPWMPSSHPWTLSSSGCS